MRRCIAVLICLLPAVVPHAASAAPAPESAPAQHLTYQVITRQGGLVDVAALKWSPPGAKTVLLAIHGSGGVKENSWGPFKEPGYSFAHARYREGRAVVAIDLPGYGKSGGDHSKMTYGVEDDAFVVHQIAMKLRDQYRTVIGVGHSIGALIVDVAQGMFGTFDGIIPASWSHGGFSEAFLNNCTAGYKCVGVRDILFWRPNADRRVVNEWIKPLEPFNTLENDNWVVWSGAYTNFFGIPQAPDDVTDTIDVPVFIIFGQKDFIYDKDGMKKEPSSFPSSPDVKMLMLPNTGHAVFHHYNHRVVEDAVGKWLAAHRF